jgi:hypothetical protein
MIETVFDGTAKYARSRFEGLPGPQQDAFNSALANYLDSGSLPQVNPAAIDQHQKGAIGAFSLQIIRIIAAGMQNPYPSDSESACVLLRDALKHLKILHIALDILKHPDRYADDLGMPWLIYEVKKAGASAALVVARTISREIDYLSDQGTFVRYDGNLDGNQLELWDHGELIEPLRNNLPQLLVKVSNGNWSSAKDITSFSKNPAAGRVFVPKDRLNTEDLPAILNRVLELLNAEGNDQLVFIPANASSTAQDIDLIIKMIKAGFKLVTPGIQKSPAIDAALRSAVARTHFDSLPEGHQIRKQLEFFVALGTAEQLPKILLDVERAAKRVSSTILFSPQQESTSTSPSSTDNHDLLLITLNTSLKETIISLTTEQPGIFQTYPYMVFNTLQDTICSHLYQIKNWLNHQSGISSSGTELSKVAESTLRLLENYFGLTEINNLTVNKRIGNLSEKIDDLPHANVSAADPIEELRELLRAIDNKISEDATTCEHDLSSSNPNDELSNIVKRFQEILSPYPKIQAAST